MANQNLVMAMNLKGSITEKYINQPQHEGKLEQFSSQYHSKTVVKEHWLWNLQQCVGRPVPADLFMT